MSQSNLNINRQGNLILADVRIEGELKSNKDIYLEGVVSGSINCNKRVVISKDAIVHGDVNCDELYLVGLVAGNVYAASKIILEKAGEIRGVAMTARIEITPGARIGSGLKLSKASKQ